MYGDFAPCQVSSSVDQPFTDSCTKSGLSTGNYYRLGTSPPEERVLRNTLLGEIYRYHRHCKSEHHLSMDGYIYFPSHIYLFSFLNIYIYCYLLIFFIHTYFKFPIPSYSLNIQEKKKSLQDIFKRILGEQICSCLEEFLILFSF